MLEATRPIAIASGTAVWYHAGLPALPISWAFIREQLGRLRCAGPLVQAAGLAPPDKTLPTFSDALAAERTHSWRTIGLSTSRRKDDIIKDLRSVFQRLHEAACYARTGQSQARPLSHRRGGFTYADGHTLAHNLLENTARTGSSPRSPHTGPDIGLPLCSVVMLRLP